MKGRGARGEERRRRRAQSSIRGVFRAWTDPDRLEWFYNPSMPIPSEPIELDLRIGGVWRQQMVIDESTAYVTGGVYREIVPDERLVFTWGATDGWPRLDADRLDDGPLVTVVFGQVDGRTELTVHVELPAHLSDEGVQEWWSLAFAPAGATRSTDSLSRSQVPARRRHPLEKCAGCNGELIPVRLPRDASERHEGRRARGQSATAAAPRPW